MSYLPYVKVFYDDDARIRELPVEHMGLPAQAMACIISDLEPADVTLGWNSNDGSSLAEIATNKVLHAVVKVCLLYMHGAV